MCVFKISDVQKAFTFILKDLIKPILIIFDESLTIA